MEGLAEEGSINMHGSTGSVQAGGPCPLQQGGTGAGILLQGQASRQGATAAEHLISDIVLDATPQAREEEVDGGAEEKGGEDKGSEQGVEGGAVEGTATTADATAITTPTAIVDTIVDHTASATTPTTVVDVDLTLSDGYAVELVPGVRPVSVKLEPGIAITKPISPAKHRGGVAHAKPVGGRARAHRQQAAATNKR
jgi:hypothetical protein